MKTVIFAGGIGTRLWPLSRQNTPKQFEPIVNNKSTLQLAVDRLRPEIDWQDIYISTGQRYVDIIKKQLPLIPVKNYIIEPETKDIAAAVGLAMSFLVKQGFGQQPTAILWSDHLLKEVDNFKKALKFAAKYVKQYPKQIVFMSQTPKSANENLGWIEIGRQITSTSNFSLHPFKSLKYQPTADQAKAYFKDKKHVWNLGYFIALPDLILEYYKNLAPEFYQRLRRISLALGQADYDQVLKREYHQLDKVSFDDLILEKINPKQTVVIQLELGWIDIGNWDAIWEILDKDNYQNASLGDNVISQTQNSLIYNNTKGKIVVGVGLDNLIIVNTDDVLLVCPKQSSKQVKKIVKRLQKQAKYAKYT